MFVEVLVSIMYRLVPPDIDECEQGSDDCDGDATCNDTIGSYICTCNVGYIGEGREGTCIGNS